jgi:hypothetical protein
MTSALRKSVPPVQGAATGKIDVTNRCGWARLHASAAKIPVPSVACSTRAISGQLRSLLVRRTMPPPVAATAWKCRHPPAPLAAVPHGLLAVRKRLLKTTESICVGDLQKDPRFQLRRVGLANTRVVYS